MREGFQVLRQVPSGKVASSFHAFLGWPQIIPKPVHQRPNNSRYRWDLYHQDDKNSTIVKKIYNTNHSPPKLIKS